MQEAFFPSFFGQTRDRFALSLLFV